MKGKDLIKLIAYENLYDYEIKLSYAYDDGSDWGYAVDTYELVDLDDIGYSDKVARIRIEKKQ